nr:hypothetical protein [uncultured Roseococcus sp.]
MAAPTEIAEKLRLTMRALGCSSLKELCGRFRAANASTYFDLQRSQKWLQGKAEPRFAEVYQDWAKVLALPQDGAWIATCSLEEFQAELVARFGPRAAPTRMPARASATLGVEIAGRYAAYSLAWSPHFAGRVLRASLQLNLARAGTIGAEYREDLPIGAALFQGTAAIAGRTLHLPLHDVATGLPLFMSFALPGPPRPRSAACNAARPCCRTARSRWPGESCWCGCAARPSCGPPTATWRPASPWQPTSPRSAWCCRPTRTSCCGRPSAGSTA